MKEWDFSEAEKASKKARELGSSIPYDLYGDFLIKMGRAVEDIPYMERAIELNPTIPGVMGRLAETYFFSGNYEKATETLLGTH